MAMMFARATIEGSCRNSPCNAALMKFRSESQSHVRLPHLEAQRRRQRACDGDDVRARHHRRLVQEFAVQRSVDEVQIGIPIARKVAAPGSTTPPPARLRWR